MALDYLAVYRSLMEQREPHLKLVVDHHATLATNE
jgi:hypothetical protein